jgi:hypothetical protein
MNCRDVVQVARKSCAVHDLSPARARLKRSPDAGEARSPAHRAHDLLAEREMKKVRSGARRALRRSVLAHATRRVVRSAAGEAWGDGSSASIARKQSHASEWFSVVRISPAMTGRRRRRGYVLIPGPVR